MPKFSNTPSNRSVSARLKPATSLQKKKNVTRTTILGKVKRDDLSSTSDKKTKVNGHTITGKTKVSSVSSSVVKKKINGFTALGKAEAQAYLIRRITFAHTGLGDYKKNKKNF